MSEYQHYQFDAVDRCLNPRERSAVQALSSHISVNSTSASVEYHYSDFKHDPVEVLVRYFDLFTYEANWGTQWLVFRFDEHAVEEEALGTYAIGETLTVYRKDEHLILDCTFNENYETDVWSDSGYYDDNPVLSSPYTCLYQEILVGDYRSLFLLWLKACELEPTESSSMKVPVPAGLDQLHEVHEQLISFIGINKDQVAAAQKKSQGKPPTVLADVSEELVEKLTGDTQLALLKKLLTANPVSVQAELRKAVHSFITVPGPKTTSQPMIFFHELSEEAEALAAHRLEQAKKAERERREQYLDLLDRKESTLWDKAAEFIERKKRKEYEKAILILQALQFKARETDALEDYFRRADQLFERYPSLSGLRWRLQAAGVVSLKENINLYKQGYGQSWRESNPVDKDITYLLSE